jgi:uncharacterized protein (TIGR02996 family)
MHDAFLSDILASPEDDTPRLVYADWLEENGDPDRAEFIRAQITLAKGTLKGDARRKLEARAKELESAHKKAWLGAAAGLAGTVVFFNRGFGGACQMRLEGGGRSLKDHAARLLERHPITSIDFFNTPLRRIRPFLLHPGAARLRILEASADEGPLGPGLARLLAQSPHIQQLENLNIQDQQIGEAGLEAMLRAGKFSHLRVLNIAANGLAPDGAAMLAAGPLGPLHELWIDENPIGGVGMQALADSPALAGLRELHLSSTGIGDEGAAAIASSPHLANLQELDFHTAGLRDEGAIALGASRSLRRLAKLTLTYNTIGVRGAAGLAAGPLLNTVRELWLIAVPLGPDGMAALANSGKLTKLEYLSIAENGLGDAGGEALARGHFPALRKLYCRHNQLGDAAVRALMSASFLRRLRELELPDNPLTDESARLIANQPALGGLRGLNLSNNRFTDEGAFALAASPHLGRLKHLAARGRHITDAGKARLQEGLGKKCRVTV